MLVASGAGRTLVMPCAGDVVAGKYLIVRILGEGGMGIVYEAMHQRLRQRVAIKMLLPTMLDHPVIISRFEREARAAAQLRGRHVARVNDVDITADGIPYMVMDLLEGRDLQVDIEARGRLPVPEAVDYVLQACAAMVEAHQVGIVHRDLKPSNLFLEEDGDHRRIVRVLDFGISKVSASAEAVEGKLTDVDTIVGTAMYMSPEQVRGSETIDGRADIWSLGVILYEALSGRVPWVGSPPHIAAAIVSEDAPELRTLCSIGSDLSAIVHKTLERNPDNRFANVKELAAALAPFAPVGSLGRAFAESVVVATGSHPRVAITPVASDPVDDDASKRRPDGTAPGWSHRPPPPPRGRSFSFARAALVGVLVAFVIGTLSIGSVVLFVRPRTTPLPTKAPQVPTPSLSEQPTASATPSAPASSPMPSTSGETTSSVAIKPLHPLTRPTVTTTSMSPSPAPSARPAQPKASTTSTSGASDKPLFL